MSKETIVAVLGIWVIVVPYLGFPSSWKTVIFVLSGFAVMIVGFFLRAEALARLSGQGKEASFARRTFVENQPAVQAGSAPSLSDQQGHERKEKINSLN